MPLLCFSGLNFDQGGGFYGGDTQGGQNTPSTGDKRRQRAQNLVPVKIGDIVDNREETFKVEILVLCRFVNITLSLFVGTRRNSQLALMSASTFESYYFQFMFCLTYWSLHMLMIDSGFG